MTGLIFMPPYVFYYICAVLLFGAAVAFVLAARSERVRRWAVAVGFALIAFMVALSVEWARWEWVDADTLRELSTEQGRTITYAAAYWRAGKIVKVRLRGPDIDEVRYFDGRVEGGPK